jgi:hypothetical protein
MEEYIQGSLGRAVNVITLIAPQGNINHFDIGSEDEQTSREEAIKIGSGYGEIICAKLDTLEEINGGGLSFNSNDFDVPYREVSEDDVQEARKILATASSGDGGTLTSEDIAKGGDAIKKVFAQQLVRFYKSDKGKGRTFKLSQISFGKALTIVTLPGEPFVEIALAAKEASSYSNTFVSAFGNGYCGYVPMPECFDRGGYEILTVLCGGCREDTALRMIESLEEMVK